MDNNTNPTNQSRFLIAAVLSMAVLFGWSYFFAPKKPAGDANANVAANANTATSAAPQAVPAATPPVEIKPVAQTTVPEAPRREITIKGPLYEVKLDSKGAVATSWILLHNKSPKNDYPLFADGSTATDSAPLQLISAKALEQTPREVPFRLSVGQNPVDQLINEKSYELVGTSESSVELKGQESKTLEFVLRDQVAAADTGAQEPIEIHKTFTFYADNYVSDVKVTITRNGQTVPNAKLLIGASLGDQAIKHHNFYHIEPEAVAHVNGAVFRKQGASMTFDANSQSTEPEPGIVDWAGVGDAYFAMAAVSAQPMQGLEYRATKYEFPTEPFYDGIISWVTRSQKTSETRHLITAYVPITADGSVTQVFTGTKDYFALANQYTESLSKTAGRSIEIVDLINFSNYSYIRPVTKTLSIPILYSLNFFNGLTHNYGVAIIIFTFLFYSLLFPLRWSQSRSFKRPRAMRQR